MVGDKLTPAPVLPVVAFTCTVSVSFAALARGSNVNWMAVAKHPGFAMAVAFSMAALLVSGNP